jgi:peroxiredoxin
MALTESTMLDLGTQAPDFTLPDAVSGKTVSLSDFTGRQALLVFFICPHCPYVKHINEGLAALGRDYAGKPIGLVAISSNDVVTHPADSPEGMKQQAETFGFNFPYLYDESQAVAHAYKAACTPDFFLFDSQQRLAYRGQFDSARPGNSIPVTGEDLRLAIDQLLAGKQVPADQRPSIGCNIKWKA